MIKKNPEIKKIEARKEEISKIINDLKKEEQELDVALKVLLRLSNNTESYNSSSINSIVLSPSYSEVGGSFTISEYIIKVLEFNTLRGGDGLTAGEILKEIRRWRPNLPRTSFSPLLSRLYHSKQVIKESNLYKLSNQSHNNY